MTEPAEVLPGTHRLHWLDVTTLASGMVLRLPLHEIRGKQDGPTVGLLATLHGNEVPPIEILRRVVATLDPAALSGTVLVLPMANPLAFESLSRATPFDHENLNRIFPGSPSGSLSYRIAHVISEKFLKRLSYLVDFHAGGIEAVVDYVFAGDHLEMAKAFGFRHLFRGTYPAGTAVGFAKSLGVPGIVIEVGGGVISEGRDIERGTSGVFNVLRFLGMLKGDLQKVDDGRITFDEKVVLRAPEGGILEPVITAVDIGAVLPKGTVLGRLINPYTFETTGELVAPYDQNLVTMARTFPCRIHPGDYAYQVGKVTAS